MPIIAILLFLALELVGIWYVGSLLDEQLLVWLVAGATSFIGISLLGRAKDAMDPEKLQGMMLTGGLGSLVSTVMAPMLGGVLLVVPGFITDLLGASLLFPATRALWIPLVGKLVAATMRAQMKKGGMGAMGGFQGGPGFPGSKGAPGMDPRQQDRAMKEMLAQLEKLGAGGGMGATPPAGGRPQTKVKRRKDGEMVRDADFEVID